MANVLFEIMRGRMMIDRGTVDDVYLPWIISVMNGTLKSDSIFNEKKAFQPMAYSFTKEAFAMSGRRAAQAMDQAPAGSVAVIPVIGEFLKYETECSYGGTEIASAIAKAGDMNNIIALVMDVDSGGGSEAAVPPFIEAIRYVQSKGKPVVLHGDMVASAAYYVGSFADYLMADNKISSAFGSIGVYVSFMDYTEKFSKEGIKHRMIYAPQSTLKNNEYREIIENNNEQPLIDDVLKPSADRFITTVMQNRKGKIKETSDAYKGKLFEGDAIVEEGLADGFGTLYDAISVAASMAMLRGLR